MTDFTADHAGHDVRKMWRTPRPAAGETATYLYCLTDGATVDVADEAGR